MIFEWFDTKPVDALADRLVKELAEELPPSSVAVQGTKAKASRRKVLESVFRQVRNFAAKNPLNVFKKARLANRIKWALLEGGYPNEFVDEIAFELASVMATTRRDLA
jgi:hypothetical protein